MLFCIIYMSNAVIRKKVVPTNFNPIIFDYSRRLEIPRSMLILRNTFPRHTLIPRHSLFPWQTLIPRHSLIPSPRRKLIPRRTLIPRRMVQWTWLVCRHTTGRFDIFIYLFFSTYFRHSKSIHLIIYEQKIFWTLRNQWFLGYDFLYHIF